MSKSGNTLGGEEYDNLIEVWSEHPRDSPEIMICSTEIMQRLIEQTHHSRGKSLQDTGYVGAMMGVPVWIDDRFDRIYFVSGK